jgi:hypothetical protein
MKKLGFYQRKKLPTTMWLSINGLAQYLFETFELNAKDANHRMDVAVECYRTLKADIIEFAKGTSYESYSESEVINGIATTIGLARSKSAKFGDIEFRATASPTVYN